MTRPAYYNENDPKAAAWIRELIACGLIAPGDVDERSIEDVRPSDLFGYGQHHFFAGIGGWSYALRLAGWPDDKPVWSASCPCQPFSSAGKGNGFEDERHLWPAFFHLVRQYGPPEIVGEQVASKHADAWIDLVHADLEAVGYAFGCVPFPAAGVGSPQIRDRNYWVAYANDAGLEGRRVSTERAAECLARASGVAGGMADADCQRRTGFGLLLRPEEAGRNSSDLFEAPWRGEAGRPGPVNGFWRNADWIGCTDEKWRPVEPGTFPLVDGVSARVGRLRGYGNAINAEAAAAFIRAYQETRAERVSLAERLRGRERKGRGADDNTYWPEEAA